jgi:hypothetical protein
MRSLTRCVKNLDNRPAKEAPIGGRRAYNSPTRQGNGNEIAAGLIPAVRQDRP